ncbi:MAG TPA: winged helix-turn-helix domain-containing protein, partial [Lysobacter sp.]
MDRPGPLDRAPARPRYRFGDIVVDTHAQTLTRAGHAQTLEPKAFAVLLMLLGKPGELLTRDELLDGVWGHRHVTPGVLTRAIAQLRHALADDPHQPKYIRTRHALGYCFVGELLDDVVPRADSAPAGIDAGAQPAAGLAETAHAPDAARLARG